jgi:hypothetical protein
MNTLIVYTSPKTGSKYNVFWMTGENTRGVVEVTPPDIDDADVASELVAIRYLLEECNVCGHKKTGNGLRLRVSQGAIRRLVQVRSSKDHLAPYAVFLRTRFIGADIAVEKDTGWTDHPSCLSNKSSLLVERAKPVLVTLGGFGEVEVTAHAIEQFNERFCPQIGRVWSRFCISVQQSVRAVHTKRKPISDAKHRKVGEYALDSKREVVFVVVKGDDVQSPGKIVTVTKGGPFVVPAVELRPIRDAQVCGNS